MATRSVNKRWIHSSPKEQLNATLAYLQKEVNTLKAGESSPGQFIAGTGQIMADLRKLSVLVGEGSWPNHVVG